MTGAAVAATTAMTGTMTAAVGHRARGTDAAVAATPLATGKDTQYHQYVKKIFIMEKVLKRKIFLFYIERSSWRNKGF